LAIVRHPTFSDKDGQLPMRHEFSILAYGHVKHCQRSYNPPADLGASRPKSGWRIVSPLAALVVSVRLGSSHHIFCRQTGPSAPFAAKRCGAAIQVSRHDFTLLKKTAKLAKRRHDLDQSASLGAICHSIWINLPPACFFVKPNLLFKLFYGLSASFTRCSNVLRSIKYFLKKVLHPNIEVSLNSLGLICHSIWLASDNLNLRSVHLSTKSLYWEIIPKWGFISQPGINPWNNRAWFFLLKMILFIKSSMIFDKLMPVFNKLEVPVF
jgi:hypothetical protein